MSTVTFEYVDENGKTHRAASLGEIPERYIKSGAVLAVGEDAPADGAKPQTTARANVDPRLQTAINAVGSINPNILIPIGLLIAWLTFKGFLHRILIGGIAIIWLFWLVSAYIL